MSIPALNNAMTAPSALPSFGAQKPSGELKRALDPSTPWDELVELWVKYPQATLENPLLALKALTEGKPLYALLPRICYLSLYIYLSGKRDPQTLENYIPETRRLGDERGLRDWWYQNRSCFLDQVYRERPELFQAYVKALACDPSRHVRARAAEKLPASHLGFFLEDPDPKVVRSVITNLRDHVAGLGPLWKKPHNRHEQRQDGFIKEPAEVVADVMAISKKLQVHADEKIRALNLAQDYARDDMLSYAMEHEKSNFFINFALSRNWQFGNLAGRSASLSYSLIDKAFNQVPRAALAVARHPRTDQMLRWRLTRHPDPSVSKAAWEKVEFDWVLNGLVIEEDFEELYGQNFRKTWFEQLARKKGLPRSIEKRLWEFGGSVRQALFENPWPSREVVQEWVRTKTADELIPLVDSSAHSLLIRAAARHEDPRLRAIAARLPGRPSSTLRPLLVKDPDSSVRNAVADYYLSHGHHCYHGERYARTLSELTRDPDPEIRKKICRDWKVTNEDCRRLVNDTVPEVALETLRQKPWSCYQHSLPLCSVENVSIREQAAQVVLEERACWLKFNSTFFRKFEAVLLKDEHPAVRWQLADDPWTSPGACHRLMRDSELPIQKALINGFQLARECAAQDHFLERSDKDADALARSRNPWYRACLARWDRNDRVRHRFLARDKCWFVRAITALEPTLHAFLREELKQDDHPLVRAAASGDLNHDSENPYSKTS